MQRLRTRYFGLGGVTLLVIAVLWNLVEALDPVLGLGDSRYSNLYQLIIISAVGCFVVVGTRRALACHRDRERSRLRTELTTARAERDELLRKMTELAEQGVTLTEMWDAAHTLGEREGHRRGWDEARRAFLRVTRTPAQRPHGSPLHAITAES